MVLKNLEKRCWSAETQGDRNKGKNGLYGFPEGPHDTVKAPFNIIKN
ncbi:MAG: hypothetical protein IJ530_09350 [Treponema sp.]|nr:hypothetical protein [Treponema sp.]MBQ8679957.1 hypothetical protein [Treponema sp.]